MTHKKLMAALAAVFISSLTFAVGPPLFTASGFMPQTFEKGQLNEQEAAKVAALRSKTDWYKTVDVIRLDVDRLASGGPVTISTPKGGVREFTVVDRPGYPDGGLAASGNKLWYGNCAATGEYMQLLYGKAGVVGEINGPGTNYLIASLPGGRFYTLIETIPQKISEPVEMSK